MILWRWSFIFLFFIAAEGFANVSDFEKLSDADLARLHHKAFLRVDSIDQYRAALMGVSPEGDPLQKNLVLQDFENASRNWISTVSFDSIDDPLCSRYVRNFKNLLKETNRDYRKFQKINPAGEKGLVLRARIEALEYLLKGEISLADENSEGGKTALTGAGRQCPALNRDKWITANHRIEHNLDFLNLSWWGKRGLRNSFPVSSSLMKILVHNRDINYQWAIPTFIWHTIAPVIVIEFITSGALPGLQIYSFVAKSLLRGATAILAASYGAYRGYQFGNSNFQPAPYIGDSWNEIQYSTERLLKLSLDDTQPYYEIAAQIENATLEYNENIVRRLQPQMILARDRFGSLTAARNVAEEKLGEIEYVMRKRGSPITKVSF